MSLLHKTDFLSSCGCFAFAVGGLCLIYSSLAAFVVNWTSYDRIAFGPMVWSPNGSVLAFGAQIEFTCTSLFVVDADGGELREVADIHEDELDYAWCFQDLRWNTEGDRLLFGNHCVVDVESDTAQCMPSTEIFPTATPTPTINAPYTECDHPNYIYTRAVHSSGHLAQSACLLNSDDYGLLSNDCIQTLQVCDTNTGEVIFQLDDYILQARPPRALTTMTIFLMVTSGLITVGGLVLAIVVFIVAKLPKPEKEELSNVGQ